MIEINRMPTYLSLSGLLGVDDTVEAVSQDADANHLFKELQLDN